MPNQVFIKIRKKLEDLLAKVNKQQITSAIDAYKTFANALRKRAFTTQQKEGMLQNDARQFGIIRRNHIGRMVMFFYDPKWANTLPYYDKFPLVLPIEMYDDGFLGINLHYLPPIQRARLLDTILNIYDSTHLDEKRKLKMGYNILQRYVRSRLHIPCVKRYLYSHMRSRFFLIPPEDWEMSVLLPTEQFMKAPKQRVYQESMNKVRR